MTAPFAAVAIWFVVAHILVAAPAASEAVQWKRCELVLGAHSKGEDPFSVGVSAVFRGPAGQRLEAPAFYSGDGTFKVRVAFPAPGASTWEARSDRQASGPEGHGTVRVARYTGRNPLFRHGFLQVRPGARYLTHADGTPFLWMGDTAWYAGVKAQAHEWKEYVEDRASKRFSVLQISAVRGPVEPGWPKPFDASGGPNASYWDMIDRKVQARTNGASWCWWSGSAGPTIREMSRG